MTQKQSVKAILIVEDEAVNREILRAVLQERYALTFASTGEETLKILSENPPDLILLDLILPDMNGMDILRAMKAEGHLKHTPVIVLTADHEAEVESLNIGATDFISKPYPRPEVIRARVRRTIELSEGRMQRVHAEKDLLTGLYNREAFYLSAERLDSNEPQADMDAIAININHFHMINERYGRVFADSVLGRIGEKILGLLVESGGLGCRREADTFLIYCPHRSDYTDVLDAISAGAAGDGMTENIVRLRMGVYPHADKSVDVERRFDRAKMAADTVRSTFTKAVAIYDNALHESAIFAEQLIIDFPKAIEEKQFKVYYQPKYDIRGSEPVLNSAEALVRWEHPEFGLISPGVFIPLFEGNGLIQKLDRYVWRAAAAQMRDWTDRLGCSVPVSVNVSRVDMYEPDLIDYIPSLVEEFNLNRGDMVLEVTESAYSENSASIISTVEAFRSLGFFIEMDDFGSGYSSLNMLSNMPIDALKLDMQFIRSAFKNGKNTRMLEIVIEIADSLSVPVIAEGVETAEQLFTLKSMGCDIVQGYYFSKPVPPEKFETFLQEERRSEQPVVSTRKQERRIAHDRHTYAAMHDPLTGLYNHSAFDILLYDADTDHAAVVIADVDGYSDIRDHSVTDRMLVRVAKQLRSSFRASDFICRIREDEFAVILTRVVSSQKQVILEKVQSATELLSRPEDDCPAVTLNVGIAFGDRENPGGDIFQDADAALNRAKAAGGGGCVVF